MLDEAQGTGPESPATVDAGADKPAAAVDVEKIVRERLARDRRARESEYSTRALAQVAERLGLEITSIDDLDGVRDLVEKARGGESETKSLSRRLEKLTNEIRQRDERLEQYRRREEQRTISEAVASAASGAIRPDQVVRLLADRFSIGEDGGVIVVDEKGRPTDESPEKFVESFLADNPHLLRPTAPMGGAASRPGSNGVKVQQRDLLTPEGRKSMFAELLQKG